MGDIHFWGSTRSVAWSREEMSQIDRSRQRSMLLAGLFTRTGSGKHQREGKSTLVARPTLMELIRHIRVDKGTFGRQPLFLGTSLVTNNHTFTQTNQTTAITVNGQQPSDLANSTRTHHQDRQHPTPKIYLTRTRTSRRKGVPDNVL